MADAWGGSWGTSWGASWGAGAAPAVVVTPTGGIPLSYDEWRRRKKRDEPEEVEVKPIVVERIGNADPDRPQPPIIRSAPELKAALDAAKAATSQIWIDEIRGLSRRAAKKRRRLRDEDEWLMMH